MDSQTKRQGDQLREKVPALRAETPGCSEVVHFNHAGASLVPQRVLDTVVGHLQREALIGAYEAADEAEQRLARVRGSIARLLNGTPEEVAIVENATRGWDMAFYSLPLQAGDRVLTSMSEYCSNAIAFLQLAQRGVSIEVVPNDDSGQLSVEALAGMIDKKVRLVAVSHMPTNGGLVQPAAAIGKVCREAKVLYLLDACQTAGQVPLDVHAIGCDMLSATSRKYLRGPRGAGFLWVRGDLANKLEPPFLDVHAATWVAADRYEIVPGSARFENWESNIAATLGMGAAVDLALDLGLEAIWEVVQERAEALRRALLTVPGVEVHDLGAVRGGIVSFTLLGWSAEEVQHALHQDRINVTASTPFSARWDMEARGLRGVVRSSVHYLTTDEEIERMRSRVAQLAGR